MSTIYLTNELLDVAVLRTLLAEAKALLARRQARFEEENTALLQAMKDRTAALAEAEARVKAHAVEHYEATGEKKPCDGLEVKLYHLPTYDKINATQWAQDHPEKGLLVLDEALYKKLLKVARENKLPDWADAPGELVEDPRAQIASDLNKIFPIEEIAKALYAPEDEEPANDAEAEAAEADQDHIDEQKWSGLIASETNEIRRGLPFAVDSDSDSEAGW